MAATIIITPGYTWQNQESTSAEKLNLTSTPEVSITAIDGIPIGATTPSTVNATGYSAGGTAGITVTITLSGGHVLTVKDGIVTAYI